MNALEYLLHFPWVEPLGRTLLHFPVAGSLDRVPPGRRLARPGTEPSVRASCCGRRRLAALRGPGGGDAGAPHASADGTIRRRRSPWHRTLRRRPPTPRSTPHPLIFSSCVLRSPSHAAARAGGCFRICPMKARPREWK
jgi:hypothetical protein